MTEIMHIYLYLICSYIGLMFFPILFLSPIISIIFLYLSSDVDTRWVSTEHFTDIYHFFLEYFFSLWPLYTSKVWLYELNWKLNTKLQLFEENNIFFTRCHEYLNLIAHANKSRHSAKKRSVSKLFFSCLPFVIWKTFFI